MELKFRPQKIEFKFEFIVLVYYALVFIVFESPQVLEFFIFKEKEIDSILQNIFLLPIAFCVFNVMMFFFMKPKLLLRGIFMILSGVAISIIKFMESPGIIDSVYFFVLSASCAFTVFFYKGNYLIEQLAFVNSYDSISKSKLEYLRDDIKYVLGKSIQGWLAFGASIGVSMTILFKDGFDEPQLKFSALKMLIGFIGISFGYGFWIAVPLLNGIVLAHDKMNELLIGSGDSSDLQT